MRKEFEGRAMMSLRPDHAMQSTLPSQFETAVRLPRPLSMVSPSKKTLTTSLRYGKKRSLAPLNPPKHAVGLPQRCQTPARGHNLDNTMACLNPDFIPDWLVRSTTLMTDFQSWWSEDHNAISFQHFWLSEFKDSKRKELLEMEYELLVEEIKMGFGEGLQVERVTEMDVATLMRAILREYPSQFGSGDDGTSFIDLILVLGNPKTPEFRMMLSDVKCSTNNPVYAQWLLAMRSFAMITMITAVSTFYRRFTDLQQPLRRPSTAATNRNRPSTSTTQRPRTSHARPSTAAASRTDDQAIEDAFAAAKLGHEDVLFYMLSRSKINTTIVDGLGRTLLYVAVVHKKLDVVNFLLENVSLFDIDTKADSGNTALHAAVSNQDATIVELLLSHGANPHIENKKTGATPAQIADMLELEEIATALKNVQIS
eukprot:m.177548 g.177548  ORF g.177548 m.177548 type:complete len:426 (+) comp31897_c0_seq1:230-1507(+)